MKLRAVAKPNVLELELLFEQKSASLKVLAVLARDAEVERRVSQLCEALWIHWTLLDQKEHSGSTRAQVDAMRIFSVLLLVEMEEVLAQAAFGSLKGVGKLSATRLGWLIIVEGAALLKRLRTIVHTWKYEEERCVWAQHQWTLSGLGA